MTDLLRLPIAFPQQALRDLSSLADSVGRLPAMLSGLDARLQVLGDDVATLRDTARALQLHLATLGTDITALSSTVDRADARVGGIERQLEALQGRVEHIDDGLDDRVPDLTPLPGDVARLRRDVARVLELTPDPDDAEPGALEKVRDALTPGD